MNEVKVSSGGVHGDPPDWALERARALIAPGETILGVYTVSEKNRHGAVLAPVTPLLVLPCFWPHACILSPCLCSCLYASNAYMKGIIMVVTDKRVYRSVDNSNAGSKPPCCVTGKDSADLPLSDINSIGQDNPGKMCGIQLLPTTQVVLGTPMGHPLATAGGSKHTPPSKAMIYCEDPESTMRLIREAKEALAQQAQQPIMMVQPANVGVVMPGQVVAPVAQPMEMVREDDPMTQIKKLKELLDMGAISQGEFDEKKNELMAKI